jgi:hypothetical protein
VLQKTVGGTQEVTGCRWVAMSVGVQREGEGETKGNRERETVCEPGGETTCLYSPCTIPAGRVPVHRQVTLLCLGLLLLCVLRKQSNGWACRLWWSW